MLCDIGGGRQVVSQEVSVTPFHPAGTINLDSITVVIMRFYDSPGTIPSPWVVSHLILNVASIPRLEGR